MLFVAKLGVGYLIKLLRAKQRMKQVNFGKRQPLVSVTLPAILLAKVDDRARQLGLSRSEFIRGFVVRDIGG